MKKYSNSHAGLAVRALFIVCIVLFFSVYSAQALARPAQEQAKIDYLLKAVGSSPLVFIRNGKEYNGRESQDHLRQKLDYVGGRVHTAEEFITYIASKSSVSGESYYVRFPDGKKVEAQKWLEDRLKEYKG